MPNITFLPSGKSIQVPEGTTLFEAANRVGLPVASSCSEEAVCGKCNMQIVTGGENLTPQDDAERRLLKKEKKPESDRISCLAKVVGDCTATTRYW